MMMSRADRIHREQRGLLSGKKPKIVALSATSVSYTMNVEDTIVIATSSASDGVGIIYLPALADAIGKYYYIVAPTGATAGDISVYEKETGSELSTYGDLDADDDHVMLFSDGLKWRIVLNGVA